MNGINLISHKNNFMKKPTLSKQEYFKLSQDTTNEIWSVILRNDYLTPADKKRRIEYEIRAAIERALNVECTVSGTEDGVNPYGGEVGAKIEPNPYANTFKNFHTVE